MAKTKAECRNRALRKLGKLAIGQTAEAGIASDMEDAYDQIYARLENKGLVTWSSTASIPDEFVEDIVAIMAFERSEGIPDSRYARIRDDASRAQISISSLIEGKWINDKQVEDF